MNRNPNNLTIISPKFIIKDLLSVYCNLPPYRVKEIPPPTLWIIPDKKLISLLNKLEITIQAIKNELIRRNNMKELRI